MKKDKLRIGGIGTGVIFNHAHLHALIKSPEVVLTGIYDRDMEKAEITRSNYLNRISALSEEKRIEMGVLDDLRICKSAEELYEISDAVDICTHPRYHPFYSVQAMKNNCHVMSEKPLCRTWLEADYVHSVAKETGKILQLNDDNVFLNRFRRLRNIIESNMVGPVQHIWIARGSAGLEGPVFGGWFWDRMESGGGAILDYGSHALTSMWFVLGFDKIPIEVRSMGIVNKFMTRNVEGMYKEVDNDDDAHFKVRFIDPKTGDWQTVIIEATWSIPELGRTSGDDNGYIEIECSEGTIIAANDPREDGKDYFIIRHRAFGERIIPFTYEKGEDGSFLTEVTNFALCVKNGRKPILSSEEGTKILNVLNAAQLSEYRGRVNVTPEDLKKFSLEIYNLMPEDIWGAADLIVDKLTSVTAKCQ